jgi:predicted dehydrogenase
MPTVPVAHWITLYAIGRQFGMTGQPVRCRLMRDEGDLGAVVIGTGFGCLTHVRALRAAGFRVVGLVGRDPDRTAERAARCDIEHALTSVDAALALPGVDAVTIATPPHTHGVLALEAVGAGKHVLCEKPFTRDAAEARQVLSAAEAAGVVHLLGTEFRFASGQALMTRLVAAGAIGEPRLATFLLHIPLLADPAAEVPAWWADSSQSGGWLGAHAAHVIDQVMSTLGPFSGVSAALPVISPRKATAEDSYLVHFRLSNGVAGTLQATAADWGPILSVSRIIGTGGTVWAEGDTVRLADQGGVRRVDMPADLIVDPPDPPPADVLHTAYDLLHSTGIDVGPYTRLAEVFRDRIRGRPGPDDPRPATFADGVATMDVLDAIRRSATDGTWVSISGE